MSELRDSGMGAGLWVLGRVAGGASRARATAAAAPACDGIYSQLAHAAFVARGFSTKMSKDSAAVSQ